MMGLPASVKAPALAATGGRAVAQLIAPCSGLLREISFRDTFLPALVRLPSPRNCSPRRRLAFKFVFQENHLEHLHRQSQMSNHPYLSGIFFFHYHTHSIAYHNQSILEHFKMSTHPHLSGRHILPSPKQSNSVVVLQEKAGSAEQVHLKDDV